MFVKPAPGRIVPDPDRRDALPAEGRDVEDSQYWQRRIADNDVVLATADQPQADKAARSK